MEQGKMDRRREEQKWWGGSPDLVILNKYILFIHTQIRSVIMSKHRSALGDWQHCFLYALVSAIIWFHSFIFKQNNMIWIKWIIYINICWNKITQKVTKVKSIYGLFDFYIIKHKPNTTYTVHSIRFSNRVSNSFWSRQIPSAPFLNVNLCILSFKSLGKDIIFKEIITLIHQVHT